MESVRAFVAIELPGSVKSALSQLQGNLKRSEHTSVKWVDTGSIHLTLKFLGNIATETIPELTKVLSEAARGITPFHLDSVRWASSLISALPGWCG
jgi:2'-5' RNA ligase